MNWPVNTNKYWTRVYICRGISDGHCKVLCRAQDGYCTSHHRQGDICGSGHNQLQSCEMCTSAWQRYGLRSILHGTGHNQDFGLEDQRPTSYPQIVFSLELGKVKVEMKCFPWQSQCAVREGVQMKKTFLNGHCPYRSYPPPRAGQRATWSFFSAVKNDI